MITGQCTEISTTKRREPKNEQDLKKPERGERSDYFTYGSNFEKGKNETQVASLKEADKVLNLLTFNGNRAAFAAYQRCNKFRLEIWKRLHTFTKIYIIINYQPAK